VPDAVRCSAAIVILALVLVAPLPALAQAPERFSLETTSSIDSFGGENAASRPQIAFDISATVRLSGGWQLYVRPLLRLPRTSTWDTFIYQAELRYERPGRIATRFETGYLASPIGLGMFDTNPSANPTIAAHSNYTSVMLPFDPGGPRPGAIAVSYPLGSEVTVSTTKWDARAAIVSSAPTRTFEVGGRANPHLTPVFEGGAGITPIVGLRLGASIAR